ncbi:sensor histidine kinase [Wukongibacter sp. M2B1]|uniref:sensor histidine kinase n=1 Tax=Wukongibacter sp. M2B1 TaxID=3088895 RepID=UPI003D7A2D23
MNRDYFQSLLSGLNLAYDYTLMEDNELTLDILNNVIKLTRYFCKDKEDMIMLVQELEHIEIFLHLQKLRFQKEFKYEIEGKYELNSLFIKRFCLIEPIMRFFFNHIEVQPERREIKINLKHEKNELELRIEDIYSNLLKKFSYYI